MQTYISLLRGINVTGYKVIKMEALREAYKELGFVDVLSYIQSGNVIFRSGAANTTELKTMIEAIIAEKFGFEVPVIVLTNNELKQILANNPFSNESEKETTHQYITFLSDFPDKANYDQIRETKYNKDEFRLVDKAIYVYCPGGYGTTKLNNSFFENKLKISATSRNWKTSIELLNLAEKVSETAEN
jgi:uncharacterized protein (DUF1697 family)